MANSADLSLSATDHTAPPRPNLEDEASRVPIFGADPIYGVGDSADFTSTQIVQETQFSTPNKNSTVSPQRRREQVMPISESPVSFLYRYMGPKKESIPVNMSICEPKNETSTNDAQTGDSEKKTGTAIIYRIEYTA